MLKIILSIPGEGRYNFLPIAILKSKNYSRKSVKLLNDIIYNSSEMWVGASIGQLTLIEHETDVQDWMRSLIMHLSNNSKNKMFLGALLAEMVQNYFDKDLGLQFDLIPLLGKLSKDIKVTQYAESWMDYQLRNFGYYDEAYWSEIKDNMRKLQDKI